MSKSQPRVLIVEDERIVAFNLRERLKRLGYQVVAIAASGEEAIARAKEHGPDLVLMDIRIEGNMDGVETAAMIARSQAVPVIYLTAHSEDGTIDRARETRPYGYLLKPFSERELHATIQMALERHATDVELAESKDRLGLALDAAEMGVWQMGPDGKSVRLEGRSAAMLGLAAERQTTAVEQFLERVDARDRSAVRGRLESLSPDLAHCEMDFRLQSTNGGDRWLRAHAKMAGIGFTQRQHTFGVIQDVTREHLDSMRLQEMNAALEVRVAQRTAELAATNEALSQFNQSVAHDLGAPVRAIQGFSAILLDTPGDDERSERKMFLARINNAAGQLQRMISGLLTLSQSVNAPLHKRRVDLASVVSGVYRMLQAAEPARSVSLAIETEVVVFADPDLMEDVVVNILSNAWKFTAGRPDASIVVGMVEHQGRRKVCIRDNGAGFEQRSAHQLFRPFQRFHASSEFPGIGIGLSTVKRIIDRHEGEISIESAPNLGTRVFIYLPDGPTATQA